MDMLDIAVLAAPLKILKKAARQLEEEHADFPSDIMELVTKHV